MTDNAAMGVPADQATAAIRALLDRGAVVEQRDLDGEVLYSGPVARDLLAIEEGDGHWMVLMRPLPIAPGGDDDGDPWFEASDLPGRPLRAFRFDLLGGHNVGIAHQDSATGEPSGIYSVVRPAVDDRDRSRIDAWDRFVAKGESHLAD